MSIEDTVRMFVPPTHYILDDGRIWSIDKTAFVSALPNGANERRCSDEADLCLHLKSFGLPLGELKTDEEYAAEARERRNLLIAETDYLAMPDYPLPEDRKAAILAYRQALRDVPEQTGFPRQIDWPVKP